MNNEEAESLRHKSLLKQAARTELIAHHEQLLRLKMGITPMQVATPLPISLKIAASPDLSPSISPGFSPNISPKFSPSVSPNISPNLSPTFSSKISSNYSPVYSPRKTSRVPSLPRSPLLSPRTASCAALPKLGDGPSKRLATQRSPIRQMWRPLGEYLGEKPKSPKKKQRGCVNIHVQALKQHRSSRSCVGLP